MPVPTPGVFTPLTLSKIDRRLGDMFGENKIRNAQYVPEISSVQMLRNMQTVKPDPKFTDPDKDYTIRLIWLDRCALGSQACAGDDCNIATGTTAGAVSQDYAMTQCRETTPFTVTMKKMRGLNIDMEEEISVNLALAIKELDEWNNNLVISAIDAASGQNQYTEAPGVVAGTTTNIDPRAWNPDLFGYFEAAADENDMDGAKLILGGPMRQELWSIRKSVSSELGAVAMNKISSLEVFEDHKAIRTALGYKAAFLLSPGTLGHFTKAHHEGIEGMKAVPLAGGGLQDRDTVTSPHTNIVYDRFHQWVCVGNDIAHTWMLRGRSGVPQSPTFCNAQKTGVLKFRCA